MGTTSLAYNKLGDVITMRCLKRKMIILFFIVITLLFLVGCTKLHEKEYYADVNNFITGEAKVNNIIYNEDGEYIVLWLSEMDEAYGSNDFIIEGENLSVVLQNGILDNIEIGDVIIYTSAPRIFGNGDFLPIIELSVEGKELLNREEGHKNLMDLY